YAAWMEKAGMPLLPHIRDTAHLRELGLLNVVDVDTCIAMIRAYATEVPLTHYYSFTLPPGLPASWAPPHLDRSDSKVIPALRYSSDGGVRGGVTEAEAVPYAAWERESLSGLSHLTH